VRRCFSGLKPTLTFENKERLMISVSFLFSVTPSFLEKRSQHPITIARRSFGYAYDTVQSSGFAKATEPGQIRVIFRMGILVRLLYIQIRITAVHIFNSNLTAIFLASPPISKKAMNF
jgi:hypothetical protein